MVEYDNLLSKSAYDESNERAILCAKQHGESMQAFMDMAVVIKLFSPVIEKYRKDGDSPNSQFTNDLIKLELEMLRKIRKFE